MPSRSLWVDYAKAIGIILVVYGHVARGVHSAGLSIDEGIYRMVDAVIYSFHMPLFFFLSGVFFLSSLQKHGVPGTLAAKLRTVAWPYLVWSVLQGLVEIQLSRLTNGSVVPADVAALLWQPRAQFWFLYALFFISVIALLVYRWLPVRWQTAVPVLACLAYLYADSLPGGIPLVFVIQYAPYFACGVVFGRMANGAVSLRPGWVAVAIWRQRRLVRAESAQITLGNLDHSDMAASHVAPYLGRDWNDKLVRSVVAERPEDIPDYAPDDVLEELAIFQAAFDSGIVDLAQLEEKFPLPYEVICGFAGAQGPAAYLARHFSSLRELLGNFIRQYQDKLAGFEVRRVLQLYRESRALPAAPEILSRYQSALDTKDHHP